MALRKQDKTLADQAQELAKNYRATHPAATLEELYGDVLAGAPGRDEVAQRWLYGSERPLQILFTDGTVLQLGSDNQVSLQAVPLALWTKAGRGMRFVEAYDPIQGWILGIKNVVTGENRWVVEKRGAFAFTDDGQPVPDSYP